MAVSRAAVLAGTDIQQVMQVAMHIVEKQILAFGKTLVAGFVRKP